MADDDPGKEAETSAAAVAQKWRVTIALHGAPGAARCRQRRREVAQEIRDRLGGEVAEEGESRVRIYVGSQETAEAAAQVAREVTGQHGLPADVSVECFHPLERLWADGATASRHDLAEEVRTLREHEQREHDAHQQEERRRSAETGIAQWQVHVKLRTHRGTVALAEQLSADGQPVIRRWRSLIAGASCEDDAHRLAETIRLHTGTDAVVRVERYIPFAGTPGC